MRQNIVCQFSAILFVGLTAYSTLSPQGYAAHSREKPPNIVLILADDLGYGDIGCFGQQTLQTPRLNDMARQGMRFTQFYAGSTICGPSRSVLLTGKHTGHTAVRGNITEPVAVQPEQLTLSSVLKEAGYATACIGKWGVGTPDNITNPNDIGFDHFFGYVNMWHAHNFYPEFLIRNGHIQQLQNKVGVEWEKWRDSKLPDWGTGVADKRVQYAPDLFVEDALHFIRINRDRPFFLFFSMNVPHANNEVIENGMEVPALDELALKDWPEPEKGFAAMIRNIDRDTGRILDLLKELGIEENTMVVFTSDNGPHEEGGHDPEFFNSNGELRGIKRDLYEGGIRVPTIVRWPSTVDFDSVSDHIGYFGDFVATAADLAGVETPEGLDSISFAPTLKGHPELQKKHEYLYWEYYERGGMQAVRFGNWKAIRQPMHSGTIELFDLSKDTLEEHDSALNHPELVSLAGEYMNNSHEADSNWKIRPSRDD
ncbi:arylsulfatase [Bythopirellula goksoeyrii]|uniref:Arylsulfatase n=1 Tax=Bythopirellula goksoeyrii TaxID=1400387 RepID=A0A5B9QFH0_9BACT|nr:arylsulfatase [Bythopirellula goksoeyrii]QEG36302.1 Arylsulfatase [Bythopirellula goksoeyrii]